jgi:hypothetical protein
LLKVAEVLRQQASPGEEHWEALRPVENVGEDAR